MNTPAVPDVDHLQMIQTNIDRMNRCSFECKKWSVGLTTAILAAAAGSKPWLGFFGIVPTIVFGLLDAYYQWIERGFRHLYDKVRKGEDTDPFIMNPAKYLDLDNPEDDYWSVLVSKTVIWVHLVTLAGALLVGWAGSEMSH